MVGKRRAKDAIGLSLETSSQRILLEEFRFLESRYTTNRESGIARMNFFVTAASVGLGGVLVFGSNNNVPFTYFRFILLAALIILAAVGLDVYSTLVARVIAADRYVRGLARIRHYFIELDPGIKDYFLSRITDAPTNYLNPKSSGMRRTAQIVESFLLGLSLTLLSTFLPLAPEANILIGSASSILIFIILEANARRRISMALKTAQQTINFGT